MRALLRNQKGISLIELLAVLALLSMMIMLISSTHLFGQKQFSSQSEQIQHEANVRYVMNVITKEIRKAPESILFENNILEIDERQIRLQGSSLYLGETVLEEGIADFKVEKNGDKISITITSEPNELQKTASLSTNLYIRE